MLMCTKLTCKAVCPCTMVDIVSIIEGSRLRAATYKESCVEPCCPQCKNMSNHSTWVVPCSSVHTRRSVFPANWLGFEWKSTVTCKAFHSHMRQGALNTGYLQRLQSCCCCRGDGWVECSLLRLPSHRCCWCHNAAAAAAWGHQD